MNKCIFLTSSWNWQDSLLELIAHAMAVKCAETLFSVIRRFLWSDFI